MKKYTSKLLLFGEHTIIKGSQALAVPLPNFYGTWQYAQEAVEEKQMNLVEFSKYLEDLQNVNELLCELDISAFRKKLAKGLYFKSNIPTGYGVGSSGALCAAVYDIFCKKKLSKTEQNFPKLKKALGQLESFFHGASSGTDPLICYLDQPILLAAKDEIRAIDFPKQKITENKPYQFFLLDTKIPRKTAPFVNLFLEKCKDDYYFSRLQSELIPDVDEAIAAFLNQDGKLLFDKIHEIGYFQFKYFAEMIPSDFRTIWLDGLASDFYKLKLCGAGGGGFILGLTNDFEKTRTHLADYPLVLLPSVF